MSYFLFWQFLRFSIGIWWFLSCKYQRWFVAWIFFETTKKTTTKQRKFFIALMRNKIILQRQRLFFLSFFQNNEHISYGKILTKKTRRKKKCRCNRCKFRCFNLNTPLFNEKSTVATTIFFLTFLTFFLVISHN